RREGAVADLGRIGDYAVAAALRAIDVVRDVRAGRAAAVGRRARWRRDRRVDTDRVAGAGAANRIDRAWIAVVAIGRGVGRAVPRHARGNRSVAGLAGLDRAVAAGHRAVDVGVVVGARRATSIHRGARRTDRRVDAVSGATDALDRVG